MYYEPAHDLLSQRDSIVGVVIFWHTLNRLKVRLSRTPGRGIILIVNPKIQLNRVLGAGVEPAHLVELEHKSSLSAIPPTGLGLSVEANLPSVAFKHLY